MARKIGERKDGTLIKDLDSLHFVSGFLYPERCENEFYFEETFDLQNTDLYIRLKNSKNSGDPYNLFQVIAAAALKTVMLKPKLNRFIANGNYYQRNDISLSFIVKKQFSETAEEGTAILRAEPGWTMEDVHKKIVEGIKAVREKPLSAAARPFDKLQKLPRFMAKSAVRFIRFADKHGFAPDSLIEKDPYHSTVMMASLGSLKMNHGFHHLTNFGTTSFFLTIGVQKERPLPNQDGTLEMKDSVTVGLALDERLADGYYYSRAAKLFKTLVENPQLLDLPFEREVEING